MNTPINIPQHIMPDHIKGIIFFDGVCPVCHFAIFLVSRLDTKSRFLISPLHGKTAQILNLKTFLTSDKLDSVVLLTQEGVVYERSIAVLNIIKQLPYPSRILYAFKLFPLWFLDAIYKLIARYRYAIFNKMNHCEIKDQKLKDRFLS